MKNFHHVSNTWLVAVLLHPFIFLLAANVFGGRLPSDLLMPIAAVGSLFSLPAYFLCVIFLPGILSRRTELVYGFVWWLASIGICVTISDVLFSLLLGGTLGSFKEIFVLSLPGLVAAWLSAVIRFQQFKNLFTNEHQTRFSDQA